MGHVENLYDSEIQVVQGTLGSTCPRRWARGTSALEIVSKIPAVTRDTNVPNKRVCSLCYQTTKTQKIPSSPYTNLPSQNMQESETETTRCKAILRLGRAGRLRAGALAPDCLGSNPGFITYQSQLTSLCTGVPTCNMRMVKVPSLRKTLTMVPGARKEVGVEGNSD